MESDGLSQQICGLESKLFTCAVIPSQALMIRWEFFC